VRNDRAIRADGQSRFVQGGGVACYLHKSLSYSILECSCNTNINLPEYLFLDVKPSSHNLLLIIMYRRPEGHLFADFFVKLNLYIPTYQNIVIAGDLNCNLLANNFESNHLKNLVSDYSLFSVPFGSTHYSGQSHSQLDVIIVDSCNKIKRFCKSSSPFAAGHCLVSICYQFSNLHRIPQTITYRNFTNCDYLALTNDLTAQLSLKMPNLPTLNRDHPIYNVESNELTASLTAFYETVSGVLNSHAPLVTEFQNVLSHGLRLNCEIELKNVINCSHVPSGREISF